jgi:hypothetical protein
MTPVKKLPKKPKVSSEDKKELSGMKTVTSPESNDYYSMSMTLKEKYLPSIKDVTIGDKVLLTVEVSITSLRLEKEFPSGSSYPNEKERLSNVKPKEFIEANAKILKIGLS